MRGAVALRGHVDRLGGRGAVSAHLQHTETLARRGPLHAVARTERGCHPTLQRVRPQVALHDHPGVAALVEAGDPPFEHAVQRLFAEGALAEGLDENVVSYGILWLAWTRLTDRL